MSDLVEPLLIVEDHFLITGRGLVVLPLLPLPQHGTVQPFSDEALVVKPDGTQARHRVGFGLEIFLLVGGNRKYSITTMFPAGTKESIPIGSQVFVSGAVRARLGR